LKNRNSFDVWFHFEPHSSLSPPPLAQHWEMIEIFVRRTDWDFFSFPSATGITAFEKKKSFCSSRYQSRTLGRTHLRQSARNLQLSEIFFLKNKGGNSWLFKK
jgi:hypothetical protein